MKQSLVEVIQSLQKTPLTPDNVQAIGKFQAKFDLDDDDPIVIVLAMMAQSQFILDALPKRLKDTTDETIELHKAILSKQATMIAKETIADVTVLLNKQSSIAMETLFSKKRIAIYIGLFFGGMLSQTLVTVLLSFFKHV